MASLSSEDMDSVNNNTMSNNNNSSNVNNNNTAGSSTTGSAANLGQGFANVLAASATTSPACSTSGEGATSATPALCSVNAADGATVSTTTSSGRRSSSRRSHSRGRSSRSHSRHRRSHHSQGSGSHHHSNRHSRNGHSNRKNGERNFPAALCSMIGIVVLCTALAEPRWVSIENGQCTLPKGRPLTYLGVFQFFSVGYIITNDPDIDHSLVNVVAEYRFGSGQEDRMINCVTERAVVIFKIIIGFTFLGIFTSLVSFGLDLVGSTNKLLKLLRRNAIFNVFTVFVCVGITLFLYLATVDISRVQQQVPAPDAVVSFDVSFYLVAAAGFVSVLGVACSCLRRVRPPFLQQNDSPTTARSILDDQFNSDIEQLVSVTPPHRFMVPSGVGDDAIPPLAVQSAPPPYTP